MCAACPAASSPGGTRAPPWCVTEMSDPAEELAELAAWQGPLRAQFPIIAAHPDLAYLDSAATSQKPGPVLEAVQTYLTTTNANAGRGSYPWANTTTALVENTREQVKRFLGDPDPESSAVHFTSGTTAGLRMIALDWLPAFLADGDEIVVPHADHQANLSPWLEAAELLARQGVRVHVRQLPYQASSGDYDPRALAALVGPRTRFVAATHVHHVHGVDMNVHRVRQVVGPHVPICLDAAQSVGHLPVSVAELDVDFLVFSGHKTLALPGSGAVWARGRRGPALRPGGWSGTPNTVGVAGLAAALDWLSAAGPDRIERWTVALTSLLTDGLARMDAYEVLGCRTSLRADTEVQRRRSLVTFRHREIGSQDLGFILFSRGFMVRSDGHCQAGRDPEDGSVRVSLHVHNTPEEIEGLLTTLASLQ
ncbi:aminotransferase class V-fold PLP-dependent enzyme [Streptomyces sp. ND05-3B]|nr:aminotransferase class V-fold PLP-dependent enzyme [Streptomyces caniscabiei]MBE4755507.1 aminotransferase class V-fold PLP-dependent enzyme [Streptomyces caniscabiei]MBE4772369.1 aminotransferase class V-fold PLP-dependent enzyme [Streptomyces caniscabiei]MBE4783209.1 aminotransferase class V-fold PLP-dependent enzyme [Streptomyces caniscabiei]MBE4792513.1 aminotransferase class V-fold PLP-dependent enzyme [Streptomyces caniscabiei]